MNVNGFKKELERIQANNQEMKNTMLDLLKLFQEQKAGTRMCCCACNQHLPSHLHPQPPSRPVPLSSSHGTIFQGSHQPRRANVPPGRFLPPIQPASPQQQRQTQQSPLLGDAFSPSPPAVVQGPVLPQSPSGGVCTLPAIQTPAVPAPPQTAKPQAPAQGQGCSRLPRLKKTSSLSVATTVTEQKSRQTRQTSKTEPRQAKNLPELAKLPPLPNPEQAIQQAFNLLSADWKMKIEALTSIRSLSQHHAEVLLPKLHDVCLAIYREVKSKQKQVSCAAVETLAHLFAYLGQSMDSEAEATVQMLLPLASLGEAGCFKEQIGLALGYMMVSITPSYSVNALVRTGLRHKSTPVRKATALHLETLTHIVGVSHLLSGKKGLTDRFIHSVSCLALDCALEVRNHARNIMVLLGSHPDLIKLVDKYGPESQIIVIKDIINKCQKKSIH